MWKQFTFVDPPGRLTLVEASVSVLLDFTESQPAREGSSLAKSSPGIDTVTPKSPLLLVAILYAAPIRARDKILLSGVIRSQGLRFLQSVQALAGRVAKMA